MDKSFVLRKTKGANNDTIWFYDKIKHVEVKQLFIYLCIYCTNDNGNMSSFKQLLDENNIENKYSAYRSSGE